jgi:hypothetical protein
MTPHHMVFGKFFSIGLLQKIRERENYQGLYDERYLPARDVAGRF